MYSKIDNSRHLYLASTFAVSSLFTEFLQKQTRFEDENMLFDDKNRDQISMHYYPGMK